MFHSLSDYDRRWRASFRKLANHFQIQRENGYGLLALSQIELDMAYEHGWAECVQRFAQNIDFDDPSPFIFGGWVEEQAGGAAGYCDARNRIYDLIRIYGKQKVSDYLQQFKLPDESTSAETNDSSAMTNTDNRFDLSGLFPGNGRRQYLDSLLLVARVFYFKAPLDLKLASRLRQIISSATPPSLPLAVRPVPRAILPSSSGSSGQ